MIISYPGAWRETQLVKHLVGRQEELTLNPGTHKKNSGLMVEAVSVLPVRQTTYQSDLLGKLQTSERPCLEKKKPTKVGTLEDDS